MIMVTDTDGSSPTYVVIATHRRAGRCTSSPWTRTHRGERGLDKRSEDLDQGSGADVAWACVLSYSYLFLSLPPSSFFPPSLPLLLLFPLFFFLAPCPLCCHSGLWKKRGCLCRILSPVHTQLLTKILSILIKAYFTDSTQGWENKMYLLMMYAFFYRTMRTRASSCCPLCLGC